MESSIFRASLESEHFRLTQMHSTDFDALYAVAKDPAIWAQHPESNRWQEAMFRRFFAAGLANPERCFVITDKDTEQVIGSTRFYRFDHREPSVWLGYTFWHDHIGVGERIRKLSKANWHFCSVMSLLCILRLGKTIFVLKKRSRSLGLKK